MGNLLHDRMASGRTFLLPRSCGMRRYFAIRDLAKHASELSSSISTIAAAVSQQVQLSENANATAGTAHDPLKELRDRAAGIVTFSDTIHDLASQTNMLALNATTEAAIAGPTDRYHAAHCGLARQLAAFGPLHVIASDSHHAIPASLLLHFPSVTCGVYGPKKRAIIRQ